MKKDNIIGTRMDDKLTALFLDYTKKHEWSKSFALAKIVATFFNYELSGDSA